MKISEIKKLKHGAPMISMEVFPPKDENKAEMMARIQGIIDCNPSYISVTQRQGTSFDTTLEVCKFIQEQGVPVMPHMTTIGLDTYHACKQIDKIVELGLDNVLCLTGDKPEGYVHKGVEYATDMIPLAVSAGLCTCASMYPEDYYTRISMYTDMKCILGAEFFITQMIYDLDCLDEVCRNLCYDKYRIIPGILPVYTESSYNKIKDQVYIQPKEIMLGVDPAVKLIESCFERGYEHVHIYTMNRPKETEEIVTRLNRDGFI